MKAVNEKEFKALIKKYESITEDMLLEESEEDDSIADTLGRTTGFGSQRTCTLCKGARRENFIVCELCVYGIISSSPGPLSITCDDRENAETYNAILNSDNLTDLLLAIQNRAKHMRKVWKQYLKQR